MSYDPHQPPDRPVRPTPAWPPEYGQQRTQPLRPAQLGLQPTSRTALARRARWHVYAAVFLCAVIAAGVGWLIYGWKLRTDPGMSACSAIRAPGGLTLNPADGPWTEDEYQAIRARFAGSRYGPIRAEGVALVDSIWTYSRPETTALKGRWLLDGPIAHHSAGLERACAAQGITIDLP